MEDQATEDISGMEEFIFLKIPSLINEAVFGITPDSDKSAIMSYGTPSSPMITALELSAMILTHFRNNTASADIFVMNEYKTSEFLYVVEVFDANWLFGFYNYLGYFEVFYNIIILADDLKCR